MFEPSSAFSCSLKCKMKFFQLMILYLIHSPVANCHHYYRRHSGSGEVRMNSRHYSSESDSYERGYRYPVFWPQLIPPQPSFPLWPLFPGLLPQPPPAPVTPPPPGPATTQNPTPAPGPPTTNPRGDNR